MRNMFLVLGCYDWIGFHLTNRLLEEGYEVTGMDLINSDKKENLAMFIGRNSYFTFLDQMDDIKESTSSIDAVIQLSKECKGKTDLIDTVQGNFYVLSSGGASLDEKAIGVTLPVLYGEWCPRDQYGFFHYGTYIRFDSDTFKKEAVYIEDFIEALLQIINASNVPSSIMYTSIEDDSRKEENFQFIRPALSQKERLNKINQHYERFSTFY